MSLLEIVNLTTEIRKDSGSITPVNNVNIELEKGEVLGIVGESGSGKTVTTRSIINLIEPPGVVESGKVIFNGKNLLEIPESELRNIRGKEISIVFQEPLKAFNPVYPVGHQIARVIRKHKGYRDAPAHSVIKNKIFGMDINDKAREEAIELLREVRIPRPEVRYSDYPHEFSGGMAQRALIAMALSCQPSLLIADEPTTGLDVTIQNELFTLLNSLIERYDMGLIMVTHDLSIAAEVCDRIAIMYAGQIVETGPLEEVFDHPFHPYTKGLLESAPQLDTTTSRLESIPGDVPDLSDLPNGCNFHPRCPYSDETCYSSEPDLEMKEDGRFAACYHSEEIQQ